MLMLPPRRRLGLGLPRALDSKRYVGDVAVAAPPWVEKVLAPATRAYSNAAAGNRAAAVALVIVTASVAAAASDDDAGGGCETRPAAEVPWNSRPTRSGGEVDASPHPFGASA